MPSYACFDSDFTQNDFHSFISSFFADCYCMAEVYEGFMVELVTGKRVKIYMKDLEKSLVGPDFFRVTMKDGKDFLFRYDTIVYMEIFPPDLTRW